MATKYNYDTALDLLCKRYDTNESVTYEELENALGLNNGSIASNTDKGTVYELRKRLKHYHGLTFHTAASGRNTGPEYHYYVLSKVKDTVIQKKKTNKDISDNNIKDMNKSLNALSKNNQELYQQLEASKLEYERLKEAFNNACERCSMYAQKEKEYKNIIDSLQKLLALKEQEYERIL